MANSKQEPKSMRELKAEKKAEVLSGAQNGSQGKKAVLAALAVGLLIAAGVWLIYPAGIPSGGQVAKGLQQPSSKTEVSLDAAQFADGKARHFAYESPDGIEVRYFVLKSSDGVIRAAFDACDVCWRANRGYTQDGDVMICNNCGRRFASIKVNEVKGGCNPAPLNRQLVDGKVVIKVADILEGRRFFDFRS